MKRHLIFALDFDTRSLLLDEINPDWEDDVKKLHRENQNNLIQQLKVEYGENGFEEKLRNFKELGPSPFSIIGYHNQLFSQCRTAFVHGLYYPALTSACALGERIFNHVILDLRDEYKSKATYKSVYGKSSFCDWPKAIDILVDWGVFLHPEVESDYRSLSEIRNRSIHFNTSTYSTLRDDALLALKTVSDIISKLFGWAAIGNLAIDGIAGFSFIKKSAESIPFVKRYYLGQSPLVGHLFAIGSGPNGEWPLFFDFIADYTPGDSDEEFGELFNGRDHGLTAQASFPYAEGVQAQYIGSST